MTLLGISLLGPHDGRVDWAGFIHNLVPVTSGNTVGGAVVLGASCYFVAVGEWRLEMHQASTLSTVVRLPKTETA